MKGKKLTVEQIEFREMLDKLKKFEPAVQDDESTKKWYSRIAASLSQLNQDLDEITVEINKIINELRINAEPSENPPGLGDHGEADDEGHEPDDESQERTETGFTGKE